MHAIVGFAIAALNGDPDLRMSALGAFDTPELIATWQRHGVAVLVRQALLARRLDVPKALAEALARVQREGVLRELLQRQGLALVTQALGNRPWLLWRGLHLAALLYDDASQRVGVDVDILVHPVDRSTAIADLEAAGFESRPSRRTGSHELTMIGHGISVDLHWHVMRPKRSRTDLGRYLFEHATRIGDWPVPDATSTLVMLLLHTALTEHVTMRLIRAVDVDRLIRTQSVDWQNVIATIRESGLRTAAWAVLRWTQRLFATPIDAGALTELQPGLMRRRYLEGWLAMDPADLYQRFPTAVRGAFSLALQDDMSGVIRAVVGLAAARLDP